MKIPNNAILVFNGTIFSVYQWQQKLFDGSYTTFEGIKRTGTIQVIPIQGDKIFLSYEEQPMKPKTYTFFGGRQDEGESPLDTAKRELLEETGMESSDWELLKQYENPGNIEWDAYLFIARNCKKVTEPHLDAGERIELKAVYFDEFLKIVTNEDFGALPCVTIDILKMGLDERKLIAFKEKLFTRFSHILVSDQDGVSHA